LALPVSSGLLSGIGHAPLRRSYSNTGKPPHGQVPDPRPSYRQARTLLLCEPKRCRESRRRSQSTDDRFRFANRPSRCRPGYGGGVFKDAEAQSCPNSYIINTN